MVKLLSHRGNNEPDAGEQAPLQWSLILCLLRSRPHPASSNLPLRSLIPLPPNQNAQIFDPVRHLQLRVSFSLNEEGAESHYLDAMNEEDVTRFKEFRDWFGGLRSVRLQIGFRGGKFEMLEEKKKNVVRRTNEVCGCF